LERAVKPADPLGPRGGTGGLRVAEPERLEPLARPRLQVEQLADGERLAVRAAQHELGLELVTREEALELERRDGHGAAVCHGAANGFRNQLAHARGPQPGREAPTPRSRLSFSTRGRSRAAPLFSPPAGNDAAGPRQRRTATSSNSGAPRRSVASRLNSSAAGCFSFSRSGGNAS